MPADEGDGDVTVLFYLCNGFVCTCMSVSVSVSDFYTIDTMPKFSEICKYSMEEEISFAKLGIVKINLQLANEYHRVLVATFSLLFYCYFNKNS